MARRQAVHGQGRQVHVRSGVGARRTPRTSARTRAGSGITTSAAIETKGDHEVSFQLKAPQPSFLALLASGYSPVYPCHVSQKDMRAKPVGTGPFKVVEFKRGEACHAGSQSRLLEEGPAPARPHRVPHDRQPLDPRAGLHGRRCRSDLRLRHHRRRAQGHQRQDAERPVPVRAVQQHDQHDRQPGRAAVRQARGAQGHGAGARPAAPSTPSSPRASR